MLPGRGPKRFQVTATKGRSITLPAAICRDLRLDAGDTVEIEAMATKRCCVVRMLARTMMRSALLHGGRGHKGLFAICREIVVTSSIG